MSREAMTKALDALLLMPARDIRVVNARNEAIAALRAALEPVQPVSLPCCGYSDPSAVMWNQYNKAVQCHNCGQVYNAAPPGYVMVPRDLTWAIVNTLREHGELDKANRLIACIDKAQVNE